METEQKLIDICEKITESFGNVATAGTIEKVWATIDFRAIKEALTESKKMKKEFSLINFDKALKIIFIQHDFTPEEQGYLITKFLKYNADIIYSEPFSYVEGIVNAEKSKKAIELAKKLSHRTIENYFGEEISPEYENQLLTEKIELQENKRLEQVQLYRTVQDFFDKEQKTEKDYLKLTSILKKLKVPSFMIHSFLKYQGYEKKKEQTFHFESFKKTVTEEPKRSKKELKSALQNYQTMESFDYANYEDVVGILRELNYSETQITNVMYDLFNKATMNYAYYKYIYEKYAMLNPNDPTLKEILDMASAMMIPESIEDYIFWKEQILAMFDNIKGEAKTNEAYDLKRVYRS